MFFEEKSLNENLQCPICNQRFHEPIFLSCGQHVCQRCINDYIEENSDQKQFKCLWCDDEHVCPANGFPRSKLMNRLLELKPKKVHRGRAIEKFNENLNHCLSKINDIKQSLVNRENIIKDKFELKRQQIHLETECKIEEINKRAREQLDQVDHLEKEHLENLKDETQQTEIETELMEAEEYCNQWVERIKAPETTEDDVINERQNLDSIKKLIRDIHLEVKRYIFSSNADLDDDESAWIDELELIIESDSSVSSRLSTVAQKFREDDHFLLDLNQFDDGNLCATYIKGYYSSNTVFQLKSSCCLYFSIFNSTGKTIKSFSSIQSFAKEDLVNGSVRSMSNGAHMLVSFFRANMEIQHIYMISSQGFHETSILLSYDPIISIDNNEIFVLFNYVEEVEIRT